MRQILFGAFCIEQMLIELVDVQLIADLIVRLQNICVVYLK